jgi:hypothetical protein
VYEAPLVLALPSVTPLATSVTADPAEITSFPTTLPLPGANTPPPETPLPVLLLVDQARSAAGADRQELSRRINRWLEQMVREGGSRHVADWFHHLIDSKRLAGLADASGQPCHETAIQGLLAMGFPYALEIHPEELARLQPKAAPLKDAGKSPRRRPWSGRELKLLGVSVLAGGGLGELLANLLHRAPGTRTLLVQVGVIGLAALAFLVSSQRPALRQLGLSVLLVASVLSIFLAVLPGYAGALSGLAGLVAALLFALRRS